MIAACVFMAQVQNPAYKAPVVGVRFIKIRYNLCMITRPEKALHVDAGKTTRTALYKEHRLTALTVKKDKVLLWTADVGIGRSVELQVDHKGDFMGWVPRKDVTLEN